MIQKEKLDAVAVVTPDFLHREIALEVASHGIHLLMEKPLDTSVKGAQKMVQAAKENNVLLFVDFHKRFDPAYINLKKQIQEGKLGKVQYGYIWMEDKIVVPSVWFKNWAKYSSPAWFIGIHFFDMLIWIFGSIQAIEVYATESTRTSGRLELEHATVNWRLSINQEDLPCQCIDMGQTTYRSIAVDGNEIEFSHGFTDLHTRVYEEILAGRGFSIIDAQPSIQLVPDIRHAKPLC